ncbi:MAG: hypothetical protein ABII00_00585 [Elusimicrobiota bacterium]
MKNQMMRKVEWLGIALLMTAMLGAPVISRAAGGHDHGARGNGHKTMGKHDGHDKHGENGKQGKTVVLTGEIIDMACYMAHEGKGKKHRKCARQCVLNDGIPAGILTDDGKVFLLMESHGQKKPYEQAKELTGDRAEITGKTYVRGGTTAVVVVEVKKVK